MKLEYISSACVLIEDNNDTILCDPWLVDGEYFGSWYHYPKCKFLPEDFNDVDYIYISHIHPDHFSAKSLSRMNKKIPILIHNYDSKYLKNNIEKLGFAVLELDHNKRTKLKNNLHINILAADNCDPNLCFKYFGCAIMEKKFGSTSIDSMAAIDNGDEVIINTNDCPFELAKDSASIIKKQYKKVDMLLTGYSSASAYPQCFELPKLEKELAKTQLQTKFVEYAEKYVNFFKPKYFMPFAGKYTLAGKFSNLNFQKGTYELEAAYDYFISSPNINNAENTCIILNSGSSFDVSTGKTSESYIRINLQEKKKYIENILSKQKYDYELDDFPEHEYLISLIPKSYERFESKRKELGFSSDTVIMLNLLEKIVIITCNGNGYKIISSQETAQFNKYVKMTLDPRLLAWLLKGPRYAVWNNAEIGSHIHFERKPNVYERGLFYCMSFFHS
jgi:UDP-MurNAc hydroxylase